MTNNDTTTQFPAFAHALMVYLNSTADYFTFGNKTYTKVEINASAASLIAQGNLIAHPGNPYTYTLPNSARRF